MLRNKLQKFFFETQYRAATTSYCQTDAMKKTVKITTDNLTGTTYPDEFVLRVKLQVTSSPVTVSLIEVQLSLVWQTMHVWVTVRRTVINAFRVNICQHVIIPLGCWEC